MWEERGECKEYYGAVFVDVRMRRSRKMRCGKIEEENKTKYNLCWDTFDKEINKDVLPVGVWRNGSHSGGNSSLALEWFSWLIEGKTPAMRRLGSSSM